MWLDVGRSLHSLQNESKQRTGQGITREKGIHHTSPNGAAIPTAIQPLSRKATPRPQCDTQEVDDDDDDGGVRGTREGRPQHPPAWSRLEM